MTDEIMSLRASEPLSLMRRNSHGDSHRIFRSGPALPVRTSAQSRAQSRPEWKTIHGRKVETNVSKAGKTVAPTATEQIHGVLEGVAAMRG